MQVKVSLAQMHAVPGDLKQNFQTGLERIQEAKRQGGEIVLLPELWLTGVDMKNASSYADQVEGEYLPLITEAAKANDITVIGSIPRKQEGKVYNASLTILNTGEIVGQYNKIHLVSLSEFSEDVYLERGSYLETVETPYGKIGSIICYDIRFPELARALALDGVKILFVPAAWPSPREEHWRTLLRARAIENQMYVVACNLAGQTEVLNFRGYSTVIDPWGERLVELGAIPQVSTVTLDLAKVEETRNRITCFADRDTERYKIR